jgi:hypothetical protein
MNKAKSTKNHSYTLPTRAANKLFSMVKIIGNGLKSYQNMMDVGSGRGSCSKALMMLNSKTKLFVVDNFHSFNAIENGTNMVAPLAISGIKSMRDRVHRMNLSIEGPRNPLNSASMNF